MGRGVTKIPAYPRGELEMSGLQHKMSIHFWHNQQLEIKIWELRYSPPPPLVQNEHNYSEITTPNLKIDLRGQSNGPQKNQHFLIKIIEEIVQTDINSTKIYLKNGKILKPMFFWKTSLKSTFFDEIKIFLTKVLKNGKNWRFLFHNGENVKTIFFLRMKTQKKMVKII